MRKGQIIKGVFVAMVTIMALSAWGLWRGDGAAADLKTVRFERLEPLRADLVQAGFRLGDPILIRIFKASSELEVWVRKGDTYALYKTYAICRWSGALGPKLKEGDGQAPEGFYTVSRAAMKPDSQYHLAFNLGFPNAYDRANGRTGSYLMVHGNCVSIGCYAMTDSGIEEIWLMADEALKGGQARFQVHAYPFRMSEDAMTRHAESEWIGFWRELKVGYDAFERRPVDLKISVVNRTYRVEAP